MNGNEGLEAGGLALLQLSDAITSTFLWHGCTRPGIHCGRLLWALECVWEGRYVLNLL